MKNRKEAAVKFAHRVIETAGNPSVKDAIECGLTKQYFEELCMRNLSNEKLINNAQCVIARYEKEMF